MGLRIGEPPMESFVGSLVREGFLRPGASITESEWLGASMPAGFRPAEIEHEVPDE
jgi:hypothetical protein